jgi:hypothetical protein
MGTGVSSPGVNQPGRDVEHPTQSSAEVKVRMEQHLHSPSEPSWPVLVQNLPLIFTFTIHKHSYI